MAKDISFEGIEEIEKLLNNLADATGITAAIQESCAIVERDAKENAPKGNGDLRRSITSRVENVNGDIQGVVFTPLEYAPYVEYGTGLFAANGDGRQDVPWSYKDDEGNWHSTSGMKPQPYLNPALNDNRETIIKLIKGGLHNG